LLSSILYLLLPLLPTPATPHTDYSLLPPAPTLSTPCTHYPLHPLLSTQSILTLPIHSTHYFLHTPVHAPTTSTPPTLDTHYSLHLLLTAPTVPHSHYICLPALIPAIPPAAELYCLYSLFTITALTNTYTHRSIQPLAFIPLFTTRAATLTGYPLHPRLCTTATSPCTTPLPIIRSTHHSLRPVLGTPPTLSRHCHIYPLLPTHPPVPIPIIAHTH
jgi:hypothetical protein